MRYLYIFFFLLSTSVAACPEIDDTLEPQTRQLYVKLCRTEYELAYSLQLKSPLWTGETLTLKEASNSEVRLNLFKADPDFELGERAELSDYIGSGYDRGHMTPAKDMATMEGMIQSFYLTNMVPQVFSNNRGIWKKLEHYIRLYAVARDELIIFTGPVYGKEPKTIGANKIPVPQALFKVIYDPATKESLSILIPNEIIDSKNLHKYVTTLQDIKNKAGIEFLYGLAPTESSVLWNFK